jgi:hypothetical protein
VVCCENAAHFSGFAMNNSGALAVASLIKKTTTLRRIDIDSTL